MPTPINRKMTASLTKTIKPATFVDSFIPRTSIRVTAKSNNIAGKFIENGIILKIFGITKSGFKFDLWQTSIALL